MKQWNEPLLALPWLTSPALSVLFLALNLAVIARACHGRPEIFDEANFGTLLSSVQMFLTGWLARALYRLRAAAPAAELWRLMGLGMVYLAADDLLGLHEGIDSLFHIIIRREPTPLTDHIDDAIVGLYLLFGIVTVMRFRDEFFSALAVRWLFALCLLGGLSSVVLDAVTNGFDVLPRILGDTPGTHHLQGLLETSEDAAKLLASFFLFVCLRLTALAFQRDLDARAPFEEPSVVAEAG